MDKILNDIEHKLKEAADKAEVPNYERAWQEMEALLDKDKDRRRPILWFLVPVLVAGGMLTYFLINQNPSGKSKTSSEPVSETAAGRQKTTEAENEHIIKPNVQLNTHSKNTATLPESETASSTAIPAENLNKVAGERLQAENTMVKQKASFTKNSLSQKNKRRSFITANKNADTEDKKMQIQRKGGRNNRNAKAKSAVNIVPAAAETEESLAVAKENQISMEAKPALSSVPPSSEKEILPEEKNKKTADPVSVPAKPIVGAEDSMQLVKQPAKKMEKQGQPGRFSFALYGGIGSDPVRPFNFSKENPFVPKYGFAVGYNIGKRSAVTIGFNMHRKKYTADTTDYNTKGSSYFSYYKVSKIGAVCKVYEIPLMYHYNIGNSKKYNYFVSGGLASFIMKKEDYDYHYYYGGAMRKGHATYTKNSHLFASALLGAVVERRLNKQLTFQLSPAFAIPLNGIGQGEVKLYSAQLLFGLKYSAGRK